MATPPKRWPTNAEWCRCDCIALAKKGRAILIEALDETNDPVQLRRMARAIETFREIETKLQAVGPKGEIHHV